MRIIITMLMIITTLCVPVYCESDGIEDVGNESIADIEQEFGFSLDEFVALDAVGYIELLIDSLAERSDSPLQLFFALLLVLMLSSVTRGIAQNSTAVNTSVDTVINIVFFLMLLTPVMSVQSNLSEAITSCKNFINSFLMVFITLLATSGQPGTAAVASSFFSAAIFIVSEILIGVVLPLASVFLAIKSCSLCVNGMEFGGVAEVIRRIARYVLLAVASLFTAVLGMQSLISAAADSVALRTGKFIVGNGVPIIGPVVQEAISMVIGGVSAVKTSAGVAAIIAVIVMFSPLFFDCVIYIIMFELTSVVAEISGSAKITQLMKAAVHTMEMFFSCIVLFCLMIILSLLTFMLSGGMF